MSGEPTSAAMLELVEQIEAADGDSFDLNHAIARTLGCASEPFTASFDAAMTLLPNGADWRRLTPSSVSVYAASPYNAKAQVRYDGYGRTPAMQMCAAVLKMKAAFAAQIEAAS